MQNHHPRTNTLPLPGLLIANADSVILRIGNKWIPDVTQSGFRTPNSHAAIQRRSAEP
jgi:hypothetical protein